MFVNFESKGKEYKLKLSVSSLIQLEEKLGMNPVLLFGIKGDRVPTISDMIFVFHYALQKYQHGIKLSDSEEIFEGWLDDGHSIDDFLPILVDIYKESGLVAKDTDEKN